MELMVPLREHQRVIAHMERDLFISRLALTLAAGGSITIQAHALQHIRDYELTMTPDPRTGGVTFTATRKKDQS